jgi:hypothetical protein
MKLNIVRIQDPGVAFQERVHLSVTLATNLSNYVLLNTLLQNDGKLTNIPRHSYWFGPKFVKPGDNVILYTGPGTYNCKVRQDGGTDHFFYWGIAQTIFGSAESRATLLEITAWDTSKV